MIKRQLHHDVNNAATSIDSDNDIEVNEPDGDPVQPSSVGHGNFSKIIVAELDTQEKYQLFKKPFIPDSHYKFPSTVDGQGTCKIIIFSTQMAGDFEDPSWGSWGEVDRFHRAGRISRIAQVPSTLLISYIDRSINRATWCQRLR